LKSKQINLTSKVQQFCKCNWTVTAENGDQTPYK